MPDVTHALEFISPLGGKVRPAIHGGMVVIGLRELLPFVSLLQSDGSGLAKKTIEVIAECVDENGDAVMPVSKAWHLVRLLNQMRDRRRRAQAPRRSPVSAEAA